VTRNPARIGRAGRASRAWPARPVSIMRAAAVSYTLYVGSPAQERDFSHYLRVREDAERFGMPLIVWS
jgi:DhnA family fructose-bisphosphate aldolase class Ia